MTHFTSESEQMRKGVDVGRPKVPWFSEGWERGRKVTHPCPQALLTWHVLLLFSWEPWGEYEGTEFYFIFFLVFKNGTGPRSLT